MTWDGSSFPSQGLRIFMKMMMKIEKGFDFFETALDLICRIFTGAIVTIIFYSVVMRYVFLRPLPGPKS